MIAAMARSCSVNLATRNAKHFAGCGIDVVNPWSDEPRFKR
jgi:toxin FitB